MDLKALTAEHLEHARDRTWSLLAPLDDDELRRQVSPLMSPLCWDLAHIGHYEELWLLRALFDTTPAEPRYDDLYDAFRHPRVRPAAPADDVEASLPGATFTMGTDAEPWAYDNERPAHPVDVAPFQIDVTPVTTRAYRAFVESGGYDDERLWSSAGWAWRHDAGLEHPQGWRREGDGAWSVRRFGRRVDLPADEPVEHVCWYEADAFARWAGKRLPTEAEWEYAASWTPDGTKRRYPWGDEDPTPDRANLGRLRLGPAPVGAHPGGVSPHGVLAMVGHVWEWTATCFGGYPGFRSFPYREYSEVFFGDQYRVLRGGSWATHPVACRTTFRNWDFPIRRQIFCGFRCARDA